LRMPKKMCCLRSGPSIVSALLTSSMPPQDTQT
jgi:hypothetical protein